MREMAVMRKCLSGTPSAECETSTCMLKRLAAKERRMKMKASLVSLETLSASSMLLLASLMDISAQREV